MKVSLKLRWLFHTKIRNQKQIINISDSDVNSINKVSMKDFSTVKKRDKSVVTFTDT